MASPVAVGLKISSQIGEMGSSQERTPLPGSLHAGHLGVTHLPLNQEPHLLLHAAVFANVIMTSPGSPWPACFMARLLGSYEGEDSPVDGWGAAPQGQLRGQGCFLVRL